jgi:hypothetical protein
MTICRFVEQDFVSIANRADSAEFGDSVTICIYSDITLNVLD